MQLNVLTNVEFSTISHVARPTATCITVKRKGCFDLIWLPKFPAWSALLQWSLTALHSKND